MPAIREVQRRGSRLFEVASTAKTPDMRPILEEMRNLRLAVTAADWSGAMGHSLRCLGNGYGAVRRLQTLGGSGTAEEYVSDEKRRAVLERLRTIAQREDLDQFLESALERFQVKNPRVLERIRKSMEMLRRGETEGVPILQGLERRQGSRSRLRSKSLLPMALASLSRGLLGLVHVEFNTKLAHIGLMAGRSRELDGVSEALAPEIDAFEGVLSSGQRAIYCAMVSDPGSGADVQKAQILAAEIETRLSAFARAQAVAFAAMNALRHQRRGGASEAMGRQALRAGILTREAVATHAACFRLLAGGVSAADSRVLDELRRGASAMPFDAPLPNGKNTELTALERTEDGAYVELQGFVTGLRVTRETGGKLVSRMRLLDPSSRATAQAAVVYTHLPHMGMTLGSYCDLNGTFKQASKVFEGRAAVEVERLALSELAKNSWRLRFLRSADDWYQPLRNGMNLGMSLGPHKRAADGGGRNDFGAGELIFPPFFRK